MTKLEEKRIKDKINFIQDTLYAIGGKWKLPIIVSLNSGNKRFKDLQRSIPKITSRVLSKELKDLEANKLITRTVYDSSPVTVEYALTKYCFTLEPVIESMKKWGEQHRKKITGKQ